MIRSLALSLALVLVSAACSSTRHALPSDSLSPDSRIEVTDSAADALSPPPSDVPDLLNVPDLPDAPDIIPDLPDLPDAPTDVPTPPMGCCLDDSHCLFDSAAEFVCVPPTWGDEPWGTCHLAPEPGRCYADADCNPGQECHGAAVCPCNVDCDADYLGPGICVPESPGCVPLQQEWVAETCNAANLVIWNGTACVSTCLGCCECKPFCEFTFTSMAQCQAACEDPAPADCPVYNTALADCPYTLTTPPGACPQWQCRNAPCKGDWDCPPLTADGIAAGLYCVLGNCVACWNDTQCSGDQVCRGGRCLPPKTTGCPDPAPCTGDGCKLITPSEGQCPVCQCETPYAIPCHTDEECFVYSFHPFSRCVWGRCTDCRTDEDCDYGACLPPGLCFQTDPAIDTVLGTWLLGWFGGMDHFSYFRFEPDGTFRRGAYEAQGAFADDIPPNIPCFPADWPTTSHPLVGTWEPEISESGFLIVRLTLNLPCDPGHGWQSRYLIQPGGMQPNHFQFISLDDDFPLEGIHLPANSCAPDFLVCQMPDIY